MLVPPDRGKMVVGGMVVESLAEAGCMGYGLSPDSTERSLGLEGAVVCKGFGAALGMLGKGFGSGRFGLVGCADLPMGCRCGCWRPCSLQFSRFTVAEEKEVGKPKVFELWIRVANRRV